ncbi:glycosyltransferase family protein [Croceimicrobium hydrocarbonivorans]|uniref:Glycosyltransferase family 1 protein n=1 Tax=Croceimicrobium hydrocarbonivorans TaxID=2761580 RepID=A0A7H0VIZ0_9FLAO|nr:hypothetical protein [Croceimicrobium hydrocarbonivorans]QNR25688.1 hypothetical protein H4K34_07565 [Croceimicrobium hydrocarbonivorans]
MTKVALIEFGTSHDEVLYPQYRFLEESAKHEVFLFVSEALKERLFDYPNHQVFFIPAQPKRSDLIDLHRRLRQMGIQKVVINTASGKTVRNFLWLRPKKPWKVCGVLHHLRKLEGSTTQKLISLYLKNYYFLAEYLQAKAPSLKPKLNYGQFYAGFLPDFPIDESYRKPLGETWVVVPGQLEYKRRDYQALLDSLKPNSLDPKLRFILLGKSKHSHGNGSEFEAELKNRQLEHFFLSWDNFVPNEAFYAYLAQADFVLPLIHLGQASGELYQKQISGSWNMALAFKVPMLIEAGSPGADEFEDGAYLYLKEELPGLWSKLDELKQRSYYLAPKWQFENQAQAYLDFLDKA